MHNHELHSPQFCLAQMDSPTHKGADCRYTEGLPVWAAPCWMKDGCFIDGLSDGWINCRMDG